MKRKRERQTPEQRTVRDFAEMVYSHTDAYNPCALAKRVCALCPRVYARAKYLHNHLLKITPSCAFESKDVQRRILRGFAKVVMKCNPGNSPDKIATSVWTLFRGGFPTYHAFYVDCWRSMRVNKSQPPETPKKIICV